MRLRGLAGLLLMAAPAYAGCPRWLDATSSPTRAVAIVSHGMNLKPERMTEVASILRAAGVDVLLAGFSGHCGEPDGFTWVDWYTLKADAMGFYEAAQARSRLKRVPLHLVAYSFSAPLYESLRAQARFEKRVYIAPALSNHFWYPAVRLLTYLPSWFPIPSTMPERYRATRVGRSQGAQALMDVISHWEEAIDLPARPPGGEPTLLLIHPNDELVSFSGIKKMVTEKAWSRWEIEPVQILDASDPRPQFHRIIDPPSVGKTEWLRIGQRMTQFLGLGGPTP